MPTANDDGPMRVMTRTMAMTVTETKVRITIWQRVKWLAKRRAGSFTRRTVDDLVMSRVPTW